MADVYQQLSYLNSLAGQLAGKYEEEVAENKKLRKQIGELQQEIAGNRQQLQLLEDDLKSARIARSVASGSEDSELAKAKISSLMREIDRCIALLNE